MDADAVCWLNDRGLFAGPRRGTDQQDAIAHQKAGRILADDDTVVMNSDRLLLPDRQTSLAHFMGQAILTKLPRGTGAQPIHNPECAADDDPRNPIHPRNIGVHLRTSAAKIPYLRQFAHIPPFDREHVQYQRMVNAPATMAAPSDRQAYADQGFYKNDSVTTHRRQCDSPIFRCAA